MFSKVTKAVSNGEDKLPRTWTVEQWRTARLAVWIVLIPTQGSQTMQRTGWVASQGTGCKRFPIQQELHLVVS